MNITDLIAKHEQILKVLRGVERGEKWQWQSSDGGWWSVTGGDYDLAIVVSESRPVRLVPKLGAECGGCIVEERDTLRAELTETTEKLAEAEKNYAGVVDSNQHWHVRVEQLSTDRDAYADRLEQSEKYNELLSKNDKAQSAHILALEALVERMRSALKHYSGGSLRPWDTTIADQCLSSLQPDLQLLPRVRALFGEYEESNVTRLDWLTTLLRDIRRRDEVFALLAEDDPGALIECLSECEALVRDGKQLLKELLPHLDQLRRKPNQTRL